MKVALVSSVFPPKISGPSTQTYHLAQSLKEGGVEIFVITFGPTNDFVRRDGIPVYSLRDFGLQRPREAAQGSAIARYLNAYSRMKAVLHRERPDVLHHVSGPGYLALVSGHLSRSLGIPSVVKYAGDLVWERMARRSDWRVPYEETFHHNLKTRLLTRLERHALSLFDCILSPSDFQTDSLIRILQIPRRRIVKCPNYVLLRGLNGSPRPVGKPPVILSVSRFARWKRLDDVIRAFAGLRSPEARLKIVGGGDDSLLEELKALALGLGVAERLSFSGPLSPQGVQTHFQEADIFLSATFHEPFGIVFLEAMAAGLPVVATRVGGIPELVSEGGTGFLVKPGDVKGLTRGVQRLLEDPALRERMGRLARQHVQAYDLQSHLHVFTNLYEELAKKGPQKSRIEDEDHDQ